MNIILNKIYNLILKHPLGYFNRNLIKYKKFKMQLKTIPVTQPFLY